MSKRVELLDHFGNDLMVVNMARNSMNKWHDQLEEGDERLIKYLAMPEGNPLLVHKSPFFHPKLQFRFEMPIFVARQWDRHIVGADKSEVSRRYVDKDFNFFMPSSWRSRPEKSIKQGSGADLDVLTQARLDLALEVHHNASLSLYNAMLAQGVCPEQARMVLPQSMETTFIQTGSLYFYANLCKLRLDKHAQVEIREYAQEVSDIIEPLFPISWKYLVKEQLLG
jgi:thymidylate synthase (FAD)